MTQKIKVEYSFESKAEILDKQSEEIREYESYFKNDILPEIQEIEKRKIKARERAYRIYVSMKTFKT
jgi:gas vesicle protein